MGKNLTFNDSGNDISYKELEAVEQQKTLDFDNTEFDLGKVNDKDETIEKLYNSLASSVVYVEQEEKERKIESFGIKVTNEGNLIFDVKKFYDKVSFDQLFELSQDKNFTTTELGAILMLYLVKQNTEEIFGSVIQMFLGYNPQTTKEALSLLKQDIASQKKINALKKQIREGTELNERQINRMLPTTMSYSEIKQLYDFVNDNAWINDLHFLVHQKNALETLKSYQLVFPKERKSLQYLPDATDIFGWKNLGLIPEKLGDILNDFGERVYPFSLGNIYKFHILYGEEKYKELIQIYKKKSTKYVGKGLGSLLTLESLCIDIVLGKISQEEVDTYYKSIQKGEELDIYHSSGLRRGISYEKFTEYDKRRYRKRFGEECAYLVYAQISPKEAVVYDERFSVDDIIALVENNISNKDALIYDKRFSGEDISFLIKGTLNNSIAMQYDEKFSGEDILYLKQSNVANSKAITYHEKFSGRDISQFKKASIDINNTEIKKKIEDLFELKLRSSDVVDLLVELPNRTIDDVKDDNYELKKLLGGFSESLDFQSDVLAHFRGINGLCDHLKLHPQKLTIGKRKMPLIFDAQSFGLIIVNRFRITTIYQRAMKVAYNNAELSL